MRRSTPRKAAPKPLAALALLGALTRAFGGAAVLWLLGAPGWFLAAWLISGVSVRIGTRRR